MLPQYQKALRIHPINITELQCNPLPAPSTTYTLSQPALIIPMPTATVIPQSALQFPQKWRWPSFSEVLQQQVSRPSQFSQATASIPDLPPPLILSSTFLRPTTRHHATHHTMTSPRRHQRPNTIFNPHSDHGHQPQRIKYPSPHSHQHDTHRDRQQSGSAGMSAADRTLQRHPFMISQARIGHGSPNAGEHHKQ